MFHIHDYEMGFNERDPAVYSVLKCRCGDVAPDMKTAIKRMSQSLWWFMLQTIATCALALALLWLAGLAWLVLA